MNQYTCPDACRFLQIPFAGSRDSLEFWSLCCFEYKEAVGSSQVSNLRLSFGLSFLFSVFSCLVIPDLVDHDNQFCLFVSRQLESVTTMTSINWDNLVARPPVRRESSHQHSLSANMAVSYLNRNIPSCYMTDDPPMAHNNNNNSSDNLSAPRYAPHPRPWRRQHSHSGLSFVPIPRPEQSEYTTSQQSRRPVDRGPACVSPFRSVRKMKQPFQLMLPGSPTCDQAPKDSKPSRQPSGSHGLRTWRSDNNLVNASLETFGLLPSPSLSDSRGSHPSSSSAYFSPRPDSEYEKDRESVETCDCVPEKGHDGCANVPEPEKPGEPNETHEITNMHMAHDSLVKQYDAQNQDPSSACGMEASSPNVEGEIPKTPRERAMTASSQASWAPDNFSYCQNWLQSVEAMDSTDVKSKEANRRKCQIVQVQNRIASESPSPANHNVKDVVSILILFLWHVPDPNMNQKLAVASKLKPKLVDISRQSSPSMGCSAPTTQHLVPSTPDHRQHEISAFSPDTPLGMSDSGYITQQSCFSPADSRDDKDDYTDATSMSSESISSTIVCEKPPSESEVSLPPKSEVSPKYISTPEPDASPGTSPNLSEKSEKEQLEKWWDHEWTIDQLEHGVKEFPQSKLKLTSPVIMFLRLNDEKSLLRTFRTIFPGATEADLDCLCATLIARNYIVELSASNRRDSGYSHKRKLSRLDGAESYSTLGVRFAQALPTQIKNRVLGSRSVELRTGLDRIIEELLDSICGRPNDETVKSAILVVAQVLEQP